MSEILNKIKNIENKVCGEPIPTTPQALMEIQQEGDDREAAIRSGGSKTERPAPAAGVPTAGFRFSNSQIAGPSTAGNVPKDTPQTDQITLKINVSNKLNDRKLAYYTYRHNSDCHHIFTEMKQSDPPRLPAKFIPAEIPGESAGEYRARKKLKAAELECLLEQLEDRARRSKEKYEAIDKEVLDEIRKLPCTEEKKNSLAAEWNAKTLKEEATSKKIWSNKRKWIIELPETQRQMGRIVTTGETTYSRVIRREVEEKEAQDEGLPWETVGSKRRQNSGKLSKGSNPPYPNNLNTSSGRGGKSSFFRRRGKPQRGRGRGGFI